MEDRFGRFGWSVNLSLNAFENGCKVQSRPNHCMDTTLRLDSPGTSSPCSSSLTGMKRKWVDVSKTEGFRHASLALGLGHSPSSSDSSKRSSATACTMSSAKETDEESSVDLGLNFQLHLGNDNICSPTKPAAAISKAVETNSTFDLQLSLSMGPSESIITSASLVSGQQQDGLSTPAIICSRPIVDDGSTSARWKLGTHLLPDQQNSEMNKNFPTVLEVPAIAYSVPATQDLSSTIMPTMKSSVTCTSGIINPQPRNVNTKNCQFPGCLKGARGASGFCIAHGGGRRCQKEGCLKGAEGRTIYCKAHGGGRRCEHLGCTKSAEGRTDFCIAHGGGRRCSHEGCTRAARGKSGLCIRHGGGKRCQRENCTKSAEGYSGFCIAHGGGRRCQYAHCTKGAQGSTMFCKAHGGGKRCTFPLCTKGAEGSTPFCKGHGGGKRCSFQGGGVCPKSVHGGTQFCVAHGGGKRCAVPECTKSARGRTDFCVRHGGGKRCKSEGCGKSAQGSTDFCKAHGGGKRCAWGQPRSVLGAGGPVCDRFARGKTGLCAAHSALVQDNRVHGMGMVGFITVQNPAPGKPEKMKEAAVEEDIFKETRNGGQGLVLWSGFEQTNFMQPISPTQSTLLSLPEGRVHGGSLMAMLAGGAGSASHSGGQVEGNTSEQQGRAYGITHKWM